MIQLAHRCLDNGGPAVKAELSYHLNEKKFTAQVIIQRITATHWLVKVLLQLQTIHH